MGAAAPHDRPGFEGGRLRETLPGHVGRIRGDGRADWSRLGRGRGRMTSHAAADVIFRTLFSVPIRGCAGGRGLQRVSGPSARRTDPEPCGTLFFCPCRAGCRARCSSSRASDRRVHSRADNRHETEAPGQSPAIDAKAPRSDDLATKNVEPTARTRQPTPWRGFVREDGRSAVEVQRRHLPF